jgi:prephenate dehydrogenase
MKKIALVGFGRFGKTLDRLLRDEFEVGIFHHDTNPQEIFSFSQVVFYCVPIDTFERTIKKHKSHINGHLFVDVLSVKEHPKRIFNKYLKNTNGRSLLTHPMFGPDSSKNGFNDLPIVLDQNTSTREEYVFWKSFFIKKGLRVVEMSAKEHDKLAAHSQGLTHFIGRLLEEVKLKSTPIDTLGTRKLIEVMDQTCNDSWQLFMNLQNYNSFTKRMRLQLGQAYDNLYNMLLPQRVSRKHLVFGIQGGKGSFNEEALQTYIKKHTIKKYKIKYLYTTEKVLKNLHEGTIDFGLFAIQNAVGGVVQESTYAMAKYRFKILEEFSIKICHFLMKRKDVMFSEIKTIMAHDQVFKQCKEKLKEKFPNHIQKVGEGDYIDHAKVAWGVAKGFLPKNIAILGPRILADIYNLDIVEENLQDSDNNLTTFFMVGRNT